MKFFVKPRTNGVTLLFQNGFISTKRENTSITWSSLQRMGSIGRGKSLKDKRQKVLQAILFNSFISQIVQYRVKLLCKN